MAKKKQKEESKAGDWQIIFTSLVILMVALFIMLVSYSVPKRGKLLVIRRTFIGSLGIFPSGVKTETGEEVVIPSPEEIGFEELLKTIFNYLKNFKNEEGIGLKSNNNMIVVSFLEPVLFSPGTAKLSSKGIKILRGLISILKRTSLPIRIEGYTDNIPIHNELFESNWELSGARAATVAQFFVKNGNFPQKRLCTVAYGQYHPIVPNDTPEGRKRNRRVQIVIPLRKDLLWSLLELKGKVPPSFKVWDLGF